MKLLIINGPNLNLVGKREQHIYGAQSLDDYFVELREKYPQVQIDFYQTNIEGEIIDRLQGARDYNGIVLNAGGYSHTSVAIADAIAAIDTPVVEVHISNIHAREIERHNSITGKNCKGVITGFGLDSYFLAVEYFIKNHQH